MCVCVCGAGGQTVYNHQKIQFTSNSLSPPCLHKNAHPHIHTLHTHTYTHTHTINSPTHTRQSSTSQGKLSLWVEVLTTDQAKQQPLLDITPPAPIPFEIRCIVWGVRNVTIHDTKTNQNDLMVTCQCTSNQEIQSTDKHLRSKRGVGNFNWRMMYPGEWGVSGMGVDGSMFVCD